VVVAEDFGVGSIVPPVFIHRSIVVVPFGRFGELMAPIAIVHGTQRTSIASVGAGSVEA
jgi:aspartate aminotransferase-like enzyme